MEEDILANLPWSIADEHQSLESLEGDLQERDAYLKGDNAIRNQVYVFKMAHIKKLDRQVEDRCGQIRKKFLRAHPQAKSKKEGRR